MSRPSAAHDPARQAERLERELLAGLGLGPGASNEELESAHDAVVRFLDDAPSGIRGWAAAQEATADESYALLRGPREDLAAAAAVRFPAPTAAAAAVRPTRPVASLDDEEWRDELEPVGPAKRQGQRETPGAIGRGAAATVQPDGRRRMLRRLALAAAGTAAAVVIAFVGYNFGGPSVPGFTGTPAPESSAAAVDQAQVASLMQKLTANPKDIATLQQLGDLYYTAGDFATSSTFMEKILAIDPKNVTALLALGAADFNVGQLSTAEASWRQVLQLDAKNVEAHYDLGFMYLSENPPDLTNVRAEWNQVIAIAPDSDVAKTVATHLQSLDGSPAPSGSSAPSAAPSAAPSGAAASPSPSPAPSAAAASPAPSGSGR